MCTNGFDRVKTKGICGQRLMKVGFLWSLLISMQTGVHGHAYPVPGVHMLVYQYDHAICLHLFSNESHQMFYR